MKLSGALLHGRVCCLSKSLTGCSLPVLLSCPWSPKLSPVSPSNSLRPLRAGQGDVAPTGIARKSTEDGSVRYIINPARHRHSVCSLEGQPRPRTGHQQLLSPSANFTPSPTTLPAALVDGTGLETFMPSSCSQSPVASLERGGVNGVASSHHSRYHLDPLYNATMKATPTSHFPESPRRVPQGDDMPSPAQLSVILLKLREEVRW